MGFPAKRFHWYHRQPLVSIPSRGLWVFPPVVKLQRRRDSKFQSLVGVYGFSRWSNKLYACSFAF